MVQKQVTMDFASRELHYRDPDGQKVILPFSCHAVTLLGDNGERRAVVRLAKTVKLQTNTQSMLQVHVDAEEGTTGVFCRSRPARSTWSSRQRWTRSARGW
jgi:hypothetical protein